MRNIDRIKKPATKWILTRIESATMEKVKEAIKDQPRGISQQVFIDHLVNEGLKA